MSKPLNFRSSLAVAVLCFAVMPVRADDPVRLRSGTVRVGSPVSLAGGAFAFDGTQQFNYSGGADGGNSEGDCGPCLGGDTISLTTHLPGSFFGTATYRGREYVFDFSNGSGAFTFESPAFVLPETATGDVVIEQSFQLTDTSMTLPDGSIVPIEGSGVASARFSTFEDAGDTYYFLEDITFTFGK